MTIGQVRTSVGTCCQLERLTSSPLIVAKTELCLSFFRRNAAGTTYQKATGLNCEGWRQRLEILGFSAHPQSQKASRGLSQDLDNGSLESGVWLTTATTSKHQFKMDPTTRRSSRLRNRQAGKETQPSASVGAEDSHRNKRQKTIIIPRNTSRGCNRDDIGLDIVRNPPTASNSLPDLRRSQRISPSELIRRENAVFRKENELERESHDIHDRMISLSKREYEASLMMSQLAERDARATLSQLEEHFTCALCYDILATPYSLNPALCGHTFCAMCILKWFFSRLHQGCGGWHESVDCPICRSLLTITPDHIPRLSITFPFVPNRTVAAVVESMVEKLSQVPSNSTIQPKLEDHEDVWVFGSKRRRRGECKKNGLKEETDNVVSLNVMDWREGGHLRGEWLKKDRDGKREMTQLYKSWPTLRSQDFIELKRKLGV